MTRLAPLLNLKVVFIGESTVGKTSIIEILGSGAFDGKTVPTVAGSYVAVSYSLPKTVVRMTVWDTAGQERYRSIAPLYYRDADVCCIVYAIDSRFSFEAVEVWHAAVMREINVPPKIWILGNKTDLEDQREVAKNEGAEKAAELKAEFVEVSAKFDAPGIHAIFEKIAEEGAELRETAASCRSVLHEQPEESCC
jgi:small GTP-binding protein